MFRLALAAIVLIAAAFVVSAPADAAVSGGVTLLHASGAPSIVVGPAGTQHMTVTVGAFRGEAGLARPVGDGPLGHTVTSIPVPAGIAAGTPIVVRIEPAAAGTPYLLADDPAVDTAIAGSRAAGIVIGILFAMLCLQLAGYVVTRDLSIPWYAGFVATLIFIEFFRDGAVPGLRLPSLVTLALIDIVNGVCVIGFIVVYLQLWQQAQRLFWALLVALGALAAINLTFALQPLLHGAVESVRSPVLLAGTVILLVGILVRMRDYPPARFLLAAEAMLFLSVAYRVVRTFTPYSIAFLDHWYFELGAVFDALFFGVALVLRARYALRTRRQLEERLEDATRAAEHDALTGALNRRGLQAALDEGARGTLFYVDLDGFKTINERFGHTAGDAVLVEVVQAMRTVAGTDAVLSRIGGDQFVVVIADEDRARADALAEQITGAIAQIRPGHRRTASLSASIGYAPLTGLTVDNAIRIADANAYRTKAYKQAISSTTR
jgi:diguanylate cyclase (GGDEF)-like protein